MLSMTEVSTSLTLNFRKIPSLTFRKHRMKVGDLILQIISSEQNVV